jgi:hypothetical protein
MCHTATTRDGKKPEEVGSFFSQSSSKYLLYEGTSGGASEMLIHVQQQVKTFTMTVPDSSEG